MSEKVERKFTKANVYADLTASLKAFKGAQDKDSRKAAFDALEKLVETYKPQKGGGSSANPSYEENGVTFHWCRFKQAYMPESEMVMSQGKSKGASTWASKHEYELKKKAGAVKQEALDAMDEENFALAQAKNKEAKEILASIENPETFSDENLQYLKDREAEKAKKDAEAKAEA
jgi:hypothetical protein